MAETLIKHEVRFNDGRIAEWWVDREGQFSLKIGCAVWRGNSLKEVRLKAQRDRTAVRVAFSYVPLGDSTPMRVVDAHAIGIDPDSGAPIIQSEGVSVVWNDWWNRAYRPLTATEKAELLRLETLRQKVNDRIAAFKARCGFDVKSAVIRAQPCG